METRDLLISAQNAATAAAAIYAALLNNPASDVVKFDAFEYEAIREAIFSGSLERAGQAKVQDAFPGSVPVAQPQHEPFPDPYQPPAAPAYTPQPPPPPAAPAQGGSSQCPKCNGATYDNRADNNRRRQSRNKLGPDFKCKNRDCGGCVWPGDFDQYKNLPRETR